MHTLFLATNTSFLDLLKILGICLIIYGLVIGLTRLFGLRSFSKTSGFDFAKTVAIGSILGSTITRSTDLLNGMAALIFIFLVHHFIAEFRRKKGMSDIIDNSPVILMYNGEILHENLKTTEVREEDLIPILRRENVVNRSQVLAVIMETTGDFTVLHTTDDNRKLDTYLLRGVKGLPQDLQHENGFTTVGGTAASIH